MSSSQRPSQALATASSLFNGERLAMARQLAGLKKSHLAAMIEMSPASITAWESGSKQPNRATVAKLALALRVEPQFFAGTPPPRINKPHFRSLRATPQIEQDKAEAYGKYVAEVSAMLEKAVEFPQVLLPDLSVESDERTGNPEGAAVGARRFFGVGPGPIQHVVRLAERAGVLVVFSEPGSSSIDAYSLHTTGRPIIILNPVKDDYYRQRFDAAHELGHLIMHQDAEPGGKIAEEQANRFASEFLMPAGEIAPYLPTSTAGRAWAQLAELKEHWGVSLSALLYRSRALGIMGEVSYRNAMVRMSQNGWRRAEPGRVVSLEMPSMLPRAREVLSSAGIDDNKFLAGSGLPVALYEAAASRVPLSIRSQAGRVHRANDSSFDPRHSGSDPQLCTEKV